MVNLLMRFFESHRRPASASTARRHLSSTCGENVHDLFSMVLQDTWLFEGTVAGKPGLQYDRTSRDEQLMAGLPGLRAG